MLKVSDIYKKTSIGQRMDNGWTVNGQLQKALKTTLANYSEKTKKKSGQKTDKYRTASGQLFYQTD